MFGFNISLQRIRPKRYTFARNRAIIVGMEKNLKLRLIICVSVFVAVFVALLVVASFYDLQISDALTKGSLEKGEYYSSNQFALFFEVLGDSVVYLLGGIASLILVCEVLKLQKGDKFLFFGVVEGEGAALKCLKISCTILFSGFAVYEFYEVFHDVVKYTDRYLYAALLGSGVEFSVGSGYMVAIQLIFAIVTAGLTLALLLRVKKEDIFKLAKLAVLVLIVEAAYLVLVGAIKTPIGRMRYRTMNAIGDFSYYTPWYKINGARNVDINGIIASGSAERDSALFGATDTCKSFPSGHTYCAATSFALVCLPDLFERFKKTWIKALCWTIPTVYTLTVAVCRIVVGAHFLSDVLVGGTLSFALIMIIREAIILKGAHFKAFLKKKEEIEAEEATE